MHVHDSYIYIATSADGARVVSADDSGRVVAFRYGKYTKRSTCSNARHALCVTLAKGVGSLRSEGTVHAKAAYN